MQAVFCCCTLFAPWNGRTIAVGIFVFKQRRIGPESQHDVACQVSKPASHSLAVLRPWLPYALAASYARALAIRLSERVINRCISGAINLFILSSTSLICHCGYAFSWLEYPRTWLVFLYPPRALNDVQSSNHTNFLLPSRKVEACCVVCIGSFANVIQCKAHSVRNSRRRGCPGR